MLTGTPAARSPVFLSPPWGGSRGGVRLDGCAGPEWRLGRSFTLPRSHQEAAFETQRAGERWRAFIEGDLEQRSGHVIRSQF